MMNWQTITIEQYQAVFTILKDEAFDDFEKEIQICALLSGKLEHEVEAMDLDEYKALKQQLDFVWSKIPETGRRIKHWGNYQFIHDVRNIGPGRYITLQHLLKKGRLIEDLHELSACLINHKPTWISGWQYKATEHKRYAEELKQAPFMAVYHTVVFFCNVYNLTNAALAPWLAEEMKKGKIPQEMIDTAATLLSNPLVGYYGPNE